jgi:hypothetical protein
METDIGRLGDPMYDSAPSSYTAEPQYPPLQMPSQPQYYDYQAPPPQPEKKKDLFADLDKTSYIIIFIAFILGFFMGKTMQPVILRSS